MIARIAASAIPALMLATPALAAERSWGIGSFDRLRIDAPFEVRVTTGTSPRAKAQAPDPRLLERLSVEVQGGTLTIRMQGGWSGIGRSLATPTVITLSTPSLTTVSMLAGGRVTVAGMKGDRVSLSVTGSGVLSVTGVAAQSFDATLIGTGSVSVAGRASKVRLTTNGPGTIDAAALDASDLVVQLDGAGETSARARFTAQVTSTGIGRVTVTGSPKCTVRATAAGPVQCGEGM